MEVARKEWRWIHANPFKGEVSRPKVSPAREKVFTEDEISAISLALSGGEISTKTLDAFLFALETGMRAGEIVSLRAEDCHANYVRLSMTKNGSARNVPLSTKAQEILAKYPDGFGLTSRQLDANFRRGTRLAGVNGRFHDSRRTALSRLAKQFSVMELAKISGHKDINILFKHYYQVSVEELADKLNNAQNQTDSTNSRTDNPLP